MTIKVQEALMGKQLRDTVTTDCGIFRDNDDIDGEGDND